MCMYMCVYICISVLLLYRINKIDRDQTLKGNISYRGKLSKDERNAFVTPSLERKRRNRKGMDWLVRKILEKAAQEWMLESDPSAPSQRASPLGQEAAYRCLHICIQSVLFLKCSLSPLPLRNHPSQTPEALGTCVLPPYKLLLASGDLSLLI